MTIYNAVRMKDGVHYIASNIRQCTKQLRATKCARLLQTNKLHIDSEPARWPFATFEFECRSETC